MATNERTSRPAGHEISENFKFLMSFAMGCNYYWAGQHVRASAPSTENIFRSRFFSSSLKLMDDWPPRSTSRLYPAYGGLWYFAERGKLPPWCRSDNMLDNGGGRDDAPISSPSSSIWISCAVKASDRTN